MPNVERVDPPNPEPFEPRHPFLWALLASCTWIAVLTLPMWSGKFAATYFNDQWATGYAFREWAAEQWKALGHFPLWNPEIFAGLPFVGGMHGDLFYPTAFLRLIFPTALAMNLGFAIHYVLAALFMYAFLRAWKVTWTGCVVGGMAYQLSGVIGSYVMPGHDGKLFVSTMLPLAFLALTRGLRDRRLDGYALFALTVGLALLSPHPQMAQYFLVATGLFALYLAVGYRPEASLAQRIGPLALALACVALGVGVAAIQYFPFYAYIPYSPRDESLARGFEWSATYAIPWHHVPELFLSRFTGEAFNGTYWGSNGTKLHSEYLGLPAVVLAGAGLLSRERRQLVWWLAGIGTLLFLVALGSSTPFYRLWWSVVPFVKSTRAPGMALFVVSFVVATFAAFGVERILKGEARSFGKIATIIGFAVAILAAAGLFSTIAESLAQGVALRIGGLRGDANARDAAVRLGALFSGAFLGFLGLSVWAWQLRKIPTVGFSAAVILLVGGDLFVNARTFWRYSDVTHGLFADDEIKGYLRQQPKPFRVWNLVYHQSALMADDIATWYGHHGNELHTFDVVNGRQGLNLNFSESQNGAIAALYAVNYLILPSDQLGDAELPGFHRVLDGVVSSMPDLPSEEGIRATLLERDRHVPYARLVPAAVKASLEQAAATVRDPRFPLGQVVLIDSSASLTVPPLGQNLPAPLDSARVEISEWEPGAMTLDIPNRSPQNAYLLVAENYYKDWQATVDGNPGQVVPGNGSLITVPVPAGTQSVELRYVSPEYQTGKLVTLSCLLLVLVGLVVPRLRRRVSTA